MVLKVLKLLLTIPNLYGQLYGERLEEIEAVIKTKRREFTKERKIEIKEHVAAKKTQEREIKALKDQIRGLNRENQILLDEVNTLKLRINNASGLLQLAQSKNIEELKELNRKQGEVLLEVYHNSKLDRVFVKENEKEVTEDYEKN